MANCACCGEDRKLTSEHIFPDGLSQRLGTLDIKPNQAWSQKVGKFYNTDDPIVKDLCESCNSACGRLFDTKVDDYFSIVKAGLDHVPTLLEAREKKITMPPLTIEVEEPWFSLYMLRIAWNVMRTDSARLEFNGAFEVLREYILSEGHHVSMPPNIFLGLTYKPPVNYSPKKGVKSILYNFSFADQVLLHDTIPTNRASMEVVCFRLLIGEVALENAAKKVVKNYFRNVIEKKSNGVKLMVNQIGNHVYSFRYLDPILGQSWGTPIDKLMTEMKGIKR